VIQQLKAQREPFYLLDGAHTSWLWAIYTVSNWLIDWDWGRDCKREMETGNGEWEWESVVTKNVAVKGHSRNSIVFFGLGICLIIWRMCFLSVCRSVCLFDCLFVCLYVWY